MADAASVRIPDDDDDDLAEVTPDRLSGDVPSTAVPKTPFTRRSSPQTPAQAGRQAAPAPLWADSRGEAPRPTGRQEGPPGLPTPPQPTTTTPAPTAPPDVNAFLMCKLGESLSEVARELSAMQSGGGGGGSSSRQPLHALPKGPRTLPSVKSWRAWVNTKLASWCGLQSAGFADA
eukprot:1075334-Pyramimonas_sp.AAC.1